MRPLHAFFHPHTLSAVTGSVPPSSASTNNSRLSQQPLVRLSRKFVTTFITMSPTSSNFRRRKSRKSHPQSPTLCNSTVAHSFNTSQGTPSNEKWLADTGATLHMTPHRHWFSSYTPHVIPITCANGQSIYSAGKGTVRFLSSGKNCWIWKLWGNKKRLRISGR